MPTTRKTPYRPRQRTEISQAFNDGIVTICTVTDGAASGRLPTPGMTGRVRLCYQERKLGVRRFYDAKQNQIHVERVIRVQQGPHRITSQDVAQTEDGNRYRIDLVQIVPDSYPPCLDLTLTIYEQTPGPHFDPVPIPIEPTEGGVDDG